jgi:hypothetical protein
MAVVKGEDLGAGVAEQDGGVGGDDELCVLEAAESVVNEDEEGQLTLRGEGGFGFVEQEEAVAGEFAFEEGEEGLAVRAGVQALAAIAGKNPRTEDLFVQFIEVGGGVEETFCTKEKAGAGRLSKERRRARIRESVE